MPFRCHIEPSMLNTGFVTHTSSGVVAVAPAGSRRMRGYQESVAYRLPSASTVMSLQKPCTPAAASGWGVVGAGQSQLPFAAPVARSKDLSATGAIPLRWLLPASDEQAHKVIDASCAYRPRTETRSLVPAAMKGSAFIDAAVPLKIVP